MTESLDTHLASAIKQVLLAYEADVCNGDRGMIDDHVNETVRRVKAIFNTVATEQRSKDPLHVQVSKIVNDALVEQDALTYHARSSDTHTRADAAARKIAIVIDADVAERRHLEMLNPVRGIQINYPH